MNESQLKSGTTGMEIPVVFSCQQDELLGIIHVAENSKNIGVLIVVGGAQYRVGAHRQFVLLARELAKQGIPVMRFDQRSIGDASGEFRSFDQIDNDIKSAIDIFMQQSPSLSGVVIWGLCDAASAALFYAYKDERVRGLVLLNPWVHTEQGEAKAYFKYYYLEQLISLNFWTKVFSFKFNYQKSFFSLIHLARQLLFSSAQGKENNKLELLDQNISLPIRMYECMRRFQYPVLFILSGHDLTAGQFRELVKSDTKWQQLLAEKHISQHGLLDADHTFSSSSWRQQVTNWTLDWLAKIEAAGS